MRSMLLTLAVVAFLVPSGPLQAGMLYSVEVNYDVIVTIDTQTGIVEMVDPDPVAPLARARHVHHNGLLYEINTPAGGCPNPTQIFLTTVNPVTSAALSELVPITEGVNLPEFGAVGDMTSIGSTMLVSLRPSANCAAVGVCLLADLSPAADLSNVTDFSAFGADMNGLAASSAGTIYALDERPASGEADLYRVVRPATYELVGTHAMTVGGRYIGMTFNTAGELWALEITVSSGTLRRLDPADGQVLASVALSPTPPIQSSLLGGLSDAPIPTAVRPASWGKVKVLYR